MEEAHHIAIEWQGHCDFVLPLLTQHFGVSTGNVSRKTTSNILQNLFFAFIDNALGIPVAAGLLYPIFGVLLSPMIAAAAMSFSSVLVIANALRLRAAKLT